jgi:hypothetical protein
MPAPFDHSSSWSSTILDADRQRQLGHAQFPAELRAQCRTARSLTSPARWAWSRRRRDRRLTLAELDSDALLIRLRNSAARLLQPYL